MNEKLLALVAFVSLPVWSADAPPAPSTLTPEQSMAQFRDDLMAKRSDVLAKGLTLTAEQATKFWPLFEQYQKEQSAIVDGQMKAIRQYSEKYKNPTDADALAYVGALLERDASINALRVKWLKKFQEVVPAKVAARAIHIERRLGLVTQVQLSQQIPLIAQ